MTYALPSMVAGLNVVFQKRNATDATGVVSAAGTNGGTSIGASYASGPLYVGIATDSINGLNTTVAGATYDLGVVKLGLHNISHATSTTAKTTDTMYAISAPVTDALKVAYTSSSQKVDTAASTKGSQMGAYYSLSKRTTVYLTNGSETSAQKNITAVGITHAF